MLSLEWTNCPDLPTDPVRGAVVRTNLGLGVAWIFDGDTVFVIPSIDGSIVCREMKPTSRNLVRIVGRVTDKCLSVLRDAIQDVIAVNIAPSEGWEDAAFDGESSLSWPRGQDGWQPMSVSDGTFWRRTKFPKSVG